MSAQWIPMRWPKEWHDASKLELIKGTPINCLAGKGLLRSRPVTLPS